MSGRDVCGLICAGTGLGLTLGAAFCPEWLGWGWALLALALLIAGQPPRAARRAGRKGQL